VRGDKVGSVMGWIPAFAGMTGGNREKRGRAERERFVVTLFAITVRLDNNRKI
jgi:hypothetical protein